MTAKRDDAILLDVVLAARHARDFLGVLTAEELEHDLKTQSAVLHQLIVLGEAVKRLSPEGRATIRDVDWKRIAGMRDVLTHEYDRVSVESVWRAVHSDVPSLLKVLEPLLPPET